MARTRRAMTIKCGESGSSPVGIRRGWTLIAGLPNKGIAYDLKISARTVDPRSGSWVSTAGSRLSASREFDGANGRQERGGSGADGVRGALACLIRIKSYRGAFLLEMARPRGRRGGGSAVRWRRSA